MRRNYVFGHRDDMPEDLEGMLRQCRRILLYSSINAEKWGIPPDELQLLKFHYHMAKAALEECGPEPPPEPHAIDGFTVYWDKKRRFQELLCDFHGVPVDENGCFDGEELARTMLSRKGPEWLGQWKEYLMGHVRRNAARYHMPPEWVENVRAGLDAIKGKEREPPPDDSSGGMQQVFLLFYELR
jgi:hypothetical protein